MSELASRKPKITKFTLSICRPIPRCKSLSCSMAKSSKHGLVRLSSARLCKAR